MREELRIANFRIYSFAIRNSSSSRGFVATHIDHHDCRRTFEHPCAIEIVAQHLRGASKHQATRPSAKLTQRVYAGRERNAVFDVESAEIQGYRTAGVNSQRSDPSLKVRRVLFSQVADHQYRAFRISGKMQFWVVGIHSWIGRLAPSSN